MSMPSTTSWHRDMFGRSTYKSCIDLLMVHFCRLMLWRFSGCTSASAICNALPREHSTTWVHLYDISGARGPGMFRLLPSASWLSCDSSCSPSCCRFALYSLLCMSFLLRSPLRTVRLGELIDDCSLELKWTNTLSYDLRKCWQVRNIFFFRDEFEFSALIWIKSSQFHPNFRSRPW